MPNISILPRFFQSERRVYSHWGRAWVREAVQNSIDAGVTVIDIVLSNDNEVVFIDNGRGMSEETLIEKFLALGETGKGDENSIGGFGKAKILLAFSQKKYEIRSRNWNCSGRGSEFEIEKTPDYVNGVILKVVLDHPSNDFMVDAIKYVFALTNWNGKAFLNGEKLECGYVKGKKVRDLSFGQVFHNKSGGAKNKVVYRVNGVWMFDRPVDIDSSVTIEIDPQKSRDILLANRDGLGWEYQRESDQFANELATEKATALEAKKKSFVKKFGGQFFKFRKAKQIFKEVKEVTGEVNIEFLSPSVIGNFRQINFSNREEVQEQVPFEAKSLEDLILQNMIVANESEDEKIVAVAKTYCPDYWRKYNQGGDKIKLLKMWVEAIRIALENSGFEDVNWSVGFIFDSGPQRTLAQCRYEGDGYYFLINPIDDNGKMAFSLNNKSDHYKLLGRASHEVAHILENAHNQSFSYFRDSIFENILENSNENLKRVREAKNALQAI